MRTTTSLFLLAALAAPAASQAPTSSPLTDSAFARGDWTAALGGYLELAKRDSAPQVWVRIGIAQHNLGRFNEAVQSLSHARRLGSQPLSTEIRLARAYARLGDRGNAFA